jgi:arsenical pump membrane protein
MSWAIWAVAATATAGVILRPFGWPEFIWAAAGAVLLVVSGLLPVSAALAGVGRGSDVYLFLAGMMLLSELARQEGLFDAVATAAVRMARGSAARLFTLVFAVGTLVTIFLSNDATAVVLTPAVAAVARTARAGQPLPYLFTCAFIANAASFVLPISNPANLVMYGSHMPALLHWLARYTLPSLLAIITTYAVLRWAERRPLRQQISADVGGATLAAGGRMAACGIAGTAAALLIASSAGIDLGAPTFAAGVVTAILVTIRSRNGTREALRGISWGVLPLVAGLFVLVQALQTTGAIDQLTGLLHRMMQQSVSLGAWSSGIVLALGCNLVNNLPAGLIASRVLQAAHAPEPVRAAALIAVDLGPNLSVTGSLATILWLTALKREGLHIGAWRFLKLGLLVMPPALIAALAALAVE